MKNTHASNQAFRILVLFVIVCLILGKLFFPPQKPIYVFDHCIFVVGSASMHPSYPVHSMVVMKKEPFEALKAGDVIAFRSQAIGGAVALHRVVRFEADGSIVTKGDANAHEDTERVKRESYIGKCVLRITAFAGYLSLIQTFLGFCLFFVVPILAICMVRYLMLIHRPSAFGDGLARRLDS